MPSLLVRDMNEELKRALAIRAAEHGRSQVAEARAILEKELLPSKQNWLSDIYKYAQGVGGMNIPLSERHTPRMTGIRM